MSRPPEVCRCSLCAAARRRWRENRCALDIGNKEVLTQDLVVATRLDGLSDIARQGKVERYSPQGIRQLSFRQRTVPLQRGHRRGSLAHLRDNGSEHRAVKREPPDLSIGQGYLDGFLFHLQ